MEIILKELKKYQNINVTDKQFEKIEGETLAGAKVEIVWTGRGESDNGYLFALPCQSPDEGDVFVHVPFPDNSDGIGDADPQWLHLFNLLKNKRVKKIICSGGF